MLQVHNNKNLQYALFLTKLETKSQLKVIQLKLTWKNQRIICDLPD